MLRLFVVSLVALVFTVSACGGSSGTEGTTAEDGIAPPQEQLLQGRIASMARKGDGYVIRFDPWLVLTGETASVAAAEDGVNPPGEPVPNDFYTVDEGHRLFTYLVPEDATVSLLVRESDTLDWRPTAVSVEELAKVVAGTSSLRLFEPLDTGVRLTIDGDTVTSIVHQYRP